MNVECYLAGVSTGVSHLVGTASGSTSDVVLVSAGGRVSSAVVASVGTAASVRHDKTLKKFRKLSVV